MTRRHFQNAGWSAFAAAAKVVTGLLSTLLAVRLLGVGPYGYVATWLSLFVVYLSLNSGVFTMLVVRLMTFPTDGRLEDRADSIQAAAMFTAISLAVLIALTLLLGGYQAGFLNGQHEESAASGWPVFIMGLLTGLQILVAFQVALIEGAGRLDLATRRQLGGPLVVLSILGICFLVGHPLQETGYLVSLCIGSAFDMLLLWHARAALSLPVPVRLRAGHMLGVIQLLRTGGVLQATTLLNLFLEPANKFLLNSFAGSSAVAIYDLAMKVVWGIQHLFGAAMRVFLHIGSQDDRAVGRMFAKALTLLGIPALMMHAAGAIFLLLMARHWLDIDPSGIVIFFGIASVSNLGMIFVTPLYLSLIGRQDLFFILRTQAVLANVNVLASVALIPWLGLFGSAFGLLIATGINAFSIYRRCRIDAAVYTAEGIVAPRVMWRGGIAAGLLVAAVLWGAKGGDAIWAPLLILVGLMLLVPGEPLVGRTIRWFVPERS